VSGDLTEAIRTELLARFLYMLSWSVPMKEIVCAARGIERMENADMPDPDLAAWARRSARMILGQPSGLDLE